MERPQHAELYVSEFLDALDTYVDEKLSYYKARNDPNTSEYADESKVYSAREAMHQKLMELVS